MRLDRDGNLFLQEIKKIPLLSRQEIDSFLKLAKKGNQLAKKELIKGNLSLVVSIAKKYQYCTGLELEDLIDEGILGLIRAIEKFNPKRGVKFSIYAYWWIRAGILRALLEQSRTIRIPSYLGEKLNILKQVEKQFSKGENWELEEVARELNISVRELEKLLQMSRGPISLDRPVRENDDSENLLKDFIADEAVNPEEAAIEKEIKDRVLKALSTLTPREEEVIKRRFGIGKKDETLEEIGREFQLTKERIRQIENKAIQKLSKINQIKHLLE
jgi:RNA polymerase primary sigma factor